MVSAVGGAYIVLTLAAWAVTVVAVARAVCALWPPEERARWQDPDAEDPDAEDPDAEDPPPFYYVPPPLPVKVWRAVSHPDGCTGVATCRV